MAYKLLSFQYLKSKRIIYVLVFLLVFAVVAPIYSVFYWNNVKYKIEEKYKTKVALYDITNTGDTLKQVIAIQDLKYKDSLLAMYSRRIRGFPDIANIPFIYLEGTGFPLIEYTDDSILVKIIFANYKTPKFYEEYYVLTNSTHN